MADKTELIRQRMALKREALGAKLDALEDRTLGVVQETTDAVVQAVETVEDTVQSAKKAVKKTVRKSARMFDLNRQVDKHPWAVMGGAVAVGFAASWLVSRGTRAASDGRATGNGRHESDVYYRAAQAIPTTEAESPSKSNWLGGLVEMFAPSLETLKHMAIGTSMAVARDVVLQAVPPQFADQLNDVFGGLSERLGGDPLPEPQLAEQGSGEEMPASAEVGEGSRPRWEQERAHEQRHGKKKTHGNGRHQASR